MVKRWNRVKAPKTWRPEVGEELIGVYLGSRLRAGIYGEYTAHFVQQKDCTYIVSGSMLDDLFTLLGEGEPIKLIYTGKKTSNTSGNEYKTFELYSESLVEFRLVG